MQEKFIEYVLEQKNKGETVLLSSHIFNEVEALCDRIAIIKEGRIISVVKAEEVRRFKRKTFEIAFKRNEDYQHFITKNTDIRENDEIHLKVSVGVENDMTNTFIRELSNYQLLSFTQHQQTLEDYFMHFYKSDKTFEGIAAKKGDIQGGKHHRS